MFVNDQGMKIPSAWVQTHFGDRWDVEQGFVHLKPTAEEAGVEWGYDPRPKAITEGCSHFYKDSPCRWMMLAANEEESVYLQEVLKLAAESEVVSADTKEYAQRISMLLNAAFEDYKRSHEEHLKAEFEERLAKRTAAEQAA